MILPNSRILRSKVFGLGVSFQWILYVSMNMRLVSAYENYYIQVKYKLQYQLVRLAFEANGKLVNVS